MNIFSCFPPSLFTERKERAVKSRSAASLDGPLLERRMKAEGNSDNFLAASK